jgi:hypothetical protein
MKVLIVGIARSGTSALYFKLKQALPESTWCLFEPAHFDPSDPGCPPNVLAKIVVGPPGRFHYDSFREFDRKIMMVRDPRDNIVSRILYRPCGTEAFRKDEAKIAAFLDVLRDKEADPRRISIVELIALFDRLTDANRAAWMTALHDFALDFHRANDDFFVYTYEDFIAGRYAALEDYLDIALPSGEADVTAQYEHVVRAKTVNDWKHWFTAEDVAYFRPGLTPFMRAYGYPDDWVLAAEPHINPAHASEFVRRSTALRNQQEQPHPAHATGGAL